MAAALDWPQIPGAWWGVLALLLGWLLFRGIGLLAHLAIWLIARVRGPEELYADRATPGGAVGHRGTARTDLAPRGKVFVRGELWEAEAEGPVSAGEDVEVVAAEGLTLKVRAAPANSAPDGT